MAIDPLTQLTAQILARTKSSTLGTRANSELVKAWEIGQLLRARVATDERTQQRFIEIGPTRIKTDHQFPFTPGQLLTLRVDQVGAKPELRILTPPSLTPTNNTTAVNIRSRHIDTRGASVTPPLPLNQPSPASSLSSVSQPINQAIRAIIGHQAPTTVLLPILIQNINAVSKLPIPGAVSVLSAGNVSTDNTTAKIKPSLELALKAAAQKVRDSIPLLSQLRQPLQVKQSTLNSGTFFESRLSATQLPLNLSTLAKDIKPALLQLVATVRQALIRDSKLSPQLAARLESKLVEIITKTKSSPALAKSTEAQTRIEVARLLQLQPLQQLLKTSESLLSRIQLNQLSSLAQSNEANQVWHVEIPYADSDRNGALQFRINKENPGGKDDEDGAWQLEFNFELGSHGTVRSDIRLKGKSINLRFTAETTSGLTLLQDNIKLLDKRLRKLGFDVNTQPARQGEIADLLQPHRLNKLLDTHV